MASPALFIHPTLPRTTLSPNPPAGHITPHCTHAIKVLRTTPHWVAISKPPNLLVHRTRLTPHPTHEATLMSLLPSLLPHHPCPAPVHRLDRPTSGLMLLAFPGFAAPLQHALRAADKTYFALACGAGMPEEWVNEHALRDMDGARKVRAARTEFEVVRRYGRADVVAVQATIRTGRRHQIRRHLSNSKYPVLGDTMHGKGAVNRRVREQFAVSRCCLHSELLRFEDPFTGEMVRLSVPIPQDLVAVCEALEEYEMGSAADGEGDEGEVEEGVVGLGASLDLA